MKLQEKILTRYKLISSGKTDFLSLCKKIDGLSNCENWIKTGDFPKEEKHQQKLLELIELRLIEDEKIKQINVKFVEVVKNY